MESLQELVTRWDGEYVITAFDGHTETWIFVAIHDRTLGPALGGLRINTYPTPADGLRDAMRLAEGMTHKWAALGLPRGGGKSVLAVSRPLKGDARRDVLHRYGRIVASLQGSYSCGPDLGSTPEDMRTVNDETPYAHGWDHGRRQPLDPGPYTALGVLSGMQSALREVFGSDALADRTVLVQGVGDVGIPLARSLAEAGATLALADVDAERARAFADELGAEVVAPEDVYGFPCDVYAPCAVGATLNADTVPRLQCAIVAGSANNQLGESADGDRLHERGILYAPDYVINAGGAAALPALSEGAAEAPVLERVRAIGTTLDEIFAEARARGEPPATTARRRVERILAEGRARR